MKKRILAFVLCLAMIFTTIDMSAVQAAENEGPENVVEEICEVCNEANGHLEDCPTLCTCTSVEGVHAEGCKFYVAPEEEIETCEYCNAELTEDAVHAEDCLTYCTCTPVEGVHAEGCKFYIAPEEEIEECEYCNVQLTEDAVHAEDCLTHCTCTPVEGVHQGDCVFAPALESADPQVGDTIWIKHGSLTYKGTTTDSKSREVLFNYETRIVDVVIADDGSVWYEFEPVGLLKWFKDFKYVQAANTSVEEPDDVDEPEEDDNTPSTEHVVGDMTIVSSVPVTLKETEADKQHAIFTDAAALFNQDESQEVFYFDISSDEGDSTITIFGIASDWNNKNVMMIHLLDDADAIAEQCASGLDDHYFVVNDTDLYEKEIAAAKEAVSDLTENRVYYAAKPVDINSDGSVTFTADSYSTFIFVVNFEYNGYKFSMSGMGSIQLSELLQSIGISKSVSSVTDVTFSDSSLLSIEKNTSDWTITSLDSFSSTEWMEITFDDGETVIIKVTDPILKYYLTDSIDWNLGTTSVSVKKSGASSAMGTYTTNTGSITPEMITQAANDIDHEEDVDLLIYARPGAAIRFASGIAFPAGTWKIADSDNDKYKYTNWEWVWDGNNNYVILNGVESNKVANLRLTVNTAVCNVRIITIPKTAELPDNVQPSKVKDTLADNSDYKVVSLPVTLYNYDGKSFNDYNNDVTNGNWLAFHGVSMGVSSHAGMLLPWTDMNLPNSGNVSTGIMEDKLVDGLPKMATTVNTDLFSTTEYQGKEVYENVGFEYLYNTNTGYYTYSSNLNHAQYNKSSNQIELYNQTLAPLLGSAQNSKAGFYPFVDINDAVLNYTATDHQSWENHLTDSYFQQNAQFARDLVASGSITTTEDGVTTTHPASNVDMHFGLQLKADFYMPTGSQLDVNNDSEKEDIIYQFTGDDDLWVYIDDQLVLDIGGAHTAISGEVNFTQKTVTLGSYANVTATGNEYRLVETGSNKTYGFTELGIEDIAEDQMHTLRIFYLERWSGESNCRMHFNLPIAPEGSVTVSKKLVNQDNQELTITPDVNYTFKIYKAKDDEDYVDATEFTALSSYPYSIVGGGNGMTDADGQFTLKEGQSAQFNNISRFTEVYVEEIKPNDGYIYTQTVVDEKVYQHIDTIDAFKSNTKVMPKGALSYTFTNYMQTQPLTIKKYVEGGSDALINPNQEFTFNLDFTKNIVEAGEDAIKAKKVSDEETSDISLTDAGSFVLKQSESITIPRVPVNMTYELSENNPDTKNNSFDSPIFKLKIGDGVETSDTIAFVKDTVKNTNKTSDFSKAIQDRGENKITVENLQHFDLKITKRILGETSTDQSFRFTVKGENSHNKATDLEVVIPASAFEADTDTSETDAVASAVIPNVPVGKYVVSEDTVWSWRYSLDNSSQKDVTVGPIGIGLPEHVAEFKNNRSNIYWLDGNSWCQNIFKEGNIVKTQTTDNPEKPTVDN